MQWMLNVKNRITAPWNTRRVLYTLIGGAIVIQSIMDKRWWLAAAGAYFFFMGLLAYGCAGGACRVPRNRIVQDNEYT